MHGRQQHVHTKYKVTESSRLDYEQNLAGLRGGLLRASL